MLANIFVCILCSSVFVENINVNSMFAMAIFYEHVRCDIPTIFNREIGVSVDKLGDELVIEILNKRRFVIQRYIDIFAVCQCSLEFRFSSTLCSWLSLLNLNFYSLVYRM